MINFIKAYYNIINEHHCFFITIAIKQYTYVSNIAINLAFRYYICVLFYYNSNHEKKTKNSWYQKLLTTYHPDINIIIGIVQQQYCLQRYHYWLIIGIVQQQFCLQRYHYVGGTLLAILRCSKGQTGCLVCVEVWSLLNINTSRYLVLAWK